LARAFAVNPSRQEARPWRALGIDRSALPSRSMLPDDECEPLAQGFHLTSPHGEAATSVGYRTIWSRGESDTSTTTQRAQRRRWGHGGGTPAIAKWPISIDARA